MLDERLLNHTSKYIVGVSGGCDSMALLDLMHKQGYAVVACHVNYHLRHDSDIDMHLVEDYCLRNDIACYVLNLKQEDYTKDNFQKQAREMRYRFYKEILERENCDAVVLGHHKDDVVETIYMQKSRGNEESKLGILETSEVMSMVILRPFLHIYKQDILDYCHNVNLEYHDDYTNFQEHFRRDYVRNRILKEYSREEKEAFIEEAKKHNAKIDEKLKDLENIFAVYDQKHQLDLRNIEKENMREVIFYMLKEVIYPPKISKGLIDEIIQEITSDKPNLHISLPVNKEFIKEYHNVYIVDKKEEHGYCYQYDSIVYQSNPYFALAKTGHINNGICIQEEDFPITIRSFQDGDMIETAGGRKKVSRLFINNKVPANLRKKWPIVVNKSGDVLLVPGLAKNKGYLYTKPNVFVIKCENEVI